MKRRLKFKVMLTAAELTHWQTAISANRILPEEQHLSEHDITRLCCGRKDPSPEQAGALADVLDCPVEEIFPNLEAERYSPDKPKLNRCRKCGRIVGETWGATDSDKMSKRAESLLCERCTRSELDPKKGGAE